MHKHVFMCLLSCVFLFIHMACFKNNWMIQFVSTVVAKHSCKLPM